MKRSIVGVISITLLSVLFFVGCASSSSKETQDPLIGTWSVYMVEHDYEDVLIFTEDKVTFMTDTEFAVQNQKIGTYGYTKDGTSITLDDGTVMPYKITKGKLTITHSDKDNEDNSYDVTYTKQ